MDHEKPFNHTDGRTFEHIGETPHRTRDGRDIKLQVWLTSCCYSGCNKALRINTATRTPQTWGNFAPRKYCSAHIGRARRDAVKARQKGLNDWLASDEGLASLKNRLGGTEAAIMKALDALALLEDPIPTMALMKAMLDAMGEPEEGKRDTRRMRVMRCVEQLIGKERIHVVNGALRLGPRRGKG